MLTWLPDAKVVDLHPAIGNGPFNQFFGVILHVNVDENGTPDSFWGNGNPGQVCPNFQVYKNGDIHQMLPLNWQPWCQIDGNFNYAAIETAGMPNELLTDAQLASCAKIVRAYHDELGMTLRVADAPGQLGLGTHEMGGAAWGGHVCPGAIRAAQRPEIIALAEGEDMGLSQDDRDWLKQQFGGIEGNVFKHPVTQDATGEDVTFNGLLKGLRTRSLNTADALAKIEDELNNLPTGTDGGLSKADVVEAVRKVFSDAAGSV